MTALLAGACFLLPLAVYWRTAYPTVHTLDVAEYGMAVPTLGIVHSPGYVTYLLLARLALLLPHGEPARLLNLLSGVAAAATVAGLALLAARVTASRMAAAGAALFFAFTHYQWTEATIATPYTLNTLWLVADLALIEAWRRTRSFRALAGFALLLGLQPGLHMSVVLQLPSFALLLLGTDWRWLVSTRRLLALGGLCLLGLSVWAYLPLRWLAAPPHNWAAAVGLDLTRPIDLYLYVGSDAFRESMFGYALARVPGQLARALGWLWENELGFGVVLGLLGWLVQLRRDRLLAVALGLGYVLHVAFYANYAVTNKDTMFLPSYLIWALWTAEALTWLLARVPRERRAALAGACLILLLLPLVANYARVDSSQNRVARTLAEAVFARAAPNALVIAFWLEVTPMQYLAIVEGQRRDLELLDLSALLHRRKRELRAAGVRGDGEARRIVQRELEALVLERLRAGQAVYLLQELDIAEPTPPSARGWRAVRDGPALRAELVP